MKSALYLISPSSDKTSVVDLDLDPYVFGPPRSGTVFILYGSGPGSGSFHQQANKVRKTLISTILWLLFDFCIYESCCKCTFEK
jgi:hypothetical protein